MKDKSRRGQGIPDWEQKRKAIRAVLGAFTDHEVLRTVFDSPADASELSAAIELLHKWKDSKPKRRTKFFNLLPAKLGCKPSVDGLSIVDANIVDFIEMLPEETRDRARRAAGVSGGAIGTSVDIDYSLSKLIIHFDTKDQSISSGLRDGIIDTRHYYSSADASETWGNLVSTGPYRTYDQCRAGLEQLMIEPNWQEALTAASPTTAVMLAGGGAPTKDLVLLRSLLDLPTVSSLPIAISIVDINYYMLVESIRTLERAKQRLSGRERVNFKYVRLDVFELGELITDHRAFERNGSTVFAITGGTIGNLSEHRFFTSLGQIAQTGDLLIVSADTINDMPPAEVKKQLTKKYDHPDMQRMIMPGVVAATHELQLHESPQEVLKRVKPRIALSEIGKLTDVPDSWSVTLVLDAGRREITLLSSTRYSAQSLATFAMKFGWELVCKVPSPLNQHYVQFAFRRK